MCPYNIERQDDIIVELNYHEVYIEVYKITI